MSSGKSKAEMGGGQKWFNVIIFGLKNCIIAFFRRSIVDPKEKKEAVNHLFTVFPHLKDKCEYSQISFYLIIFICVNFSMFLPS